MRRSTTLCIAGAAAALVAMDYVAATGFASGDTAQPVPSQAASVNRATKGDRAVTIVQSNGTSVKPVILQQPPQQPRKQAPKTDTKLLDGCELAVSPLAESANLSHAARCVS
jgi:hypothetical protein